MHIRPLEEKDRDQVLSMMEIFYNSPATLVKSPREILQKDISDCLSDLPFIEGFVCEENEALLGYFMIVKSYATEYGGICLWLEDVYLQPAAQGKGYFAAILDFVENHYKGCYVRLRLEVAKGNTQALKVYERNGFHTLDYQQMYKLPEK